MKPQIVYIHGGMTFRNRRDYLNYLKTRTVSIEPWVKWDGPFLTDELGEECQIIRPQMPLKDNSKYEDWKIHFERYFEFLNDNLILIGNSLGGIFLAKYLSENKFPKKILATYLVCPPFDNSLSGEDLAGGFELEKDLSLLDSQSGKLRLIFSKNDDVVPVSHAEKYHKKLKKAKIIIYEHIQGHFIILEFPVIVEFGAELGEETTRICDSWSVKDWSYSDFESKRSEEKW
jgi:predicted alpha/beta hydrolase family esterase